MEIAEESRDGIESFAVDPLKRAQTAAKEAKTVDELRRALAVILTTKHKLTLQEAALTIGRSKSWVAAAREDFVLRGKVANSEDHGGRRNQILPIEEEEPFMDEVCKEHRRLRRAHNWLIHDSDDYLQINRVVQRALEQRTGRSVPRSTAFALMERVGKRKFKNYHARSWNIYAYTQIQS